MGSLLLDFGCFIEGLELVEQKSKTFVGLTKPMLLSNSKSNSPKPVSGKQKMQYKEYLDLRQRIDNCFFTSMCYNIITPVLKLLEVCLCNLI